MWHTGTADGYLELLQDLVELSTNSHVDGGTLVATGTGYAAGDIVGINGGTTVGGHKAAIEVLTISGSSIATFRMARGGAYTVNPGTAATTTAETGGGSAATITTTIASTGWTVERRTQEATGASAIAVAGTGYSVSDQLTVLLGDGSQGQYGVAAVFNVDTIGGSGDVTGVSLVTAGNYEDPPTNDAQTSVAPSGGSGCELTVTYADATTQDQVLVMSGSPSGGFVDPIVAIETYQDVDQFIGSLPVRNWAVFGLPNWNDELALHQQSNISPGHDIDLGDGTFRTRGVPNLPLKDTDATYPLTFYFNINERRIIGFIEATNSTPVFHYMHLHLGYFNQAGTRGEYPYPFYVGASAWRRQAYYAEEPPVVIGGLGEAVGSANTTATAEGESSAYFYDSGNARWYSSMAFDWSDDGTTLTDDDDNHRHGLYPVLTPYNEQDSGPADVFGDSAPSSLEWKDDLFDRDEVTSPLAHLLPTPDGGTDKYLLVPLTLWGKWTDGSGATQLNGIYGEIDECFWLSAAPIGEVSSLDTFLIDGVRYRVFAGGNRTVFNTSFLAVREG